MDILLRLGWTIGLFLRLVEMSHQVGIATKVARLVPIGVTKG